jgi:hypothetical protein
LKNFNLNTLLNKTGIDMSIKDGSQNVDNTPREGLVVSGNRMDFGVYGIKCDACDYSDMTVKYEDYPNYVDKPCPHCGEPLLTKEQLSETDAAVKAAQIFNNLSDEDLTSLLAKLETLPDDKKEELMSTMPDWLKDSQVSDESKPQPINPSH